MELLSKFRGKLLSARHDGQKEEEEEDQLKSGEGEGEGGGGRETMEDETSW